MKTTYLILTLLCFSIAPSIFSQNQAQQRKVKTFINLNTNFSYNSDARARLLAKDHSKKFKEAFRHHDRRNVVADYNIPSNGYLQTVKPCAYARRITDQFSNLEVAYCPELQFYKLKPGIDDKLTYRLADILFAKTDKDGAPRSNKDDDVKLKKNQIRKFLKDTSIFIVLVEKLVNGHFRSGDTLSENLEQIIVFGAPKNENDGDKLKVWGVCLNKDLNPAPSNSLSLVKLPKEDKIREFVELFSERLNQGASASSPVESFLRKGAKVSSDISPVGKKEDIPADEHVSKVQNLQVFHQEIETKEIIKHPPRCSSPQFWYVVKAEVKTRFVAPESQDTIIHAVPLNYSVTFDQKNGEPEGIKIERIVYKDKSPIKRQVETFEDDTRMEEGPTSEELLSIFIEDFYHDLNGFLINRVHEDSVLNYFKDMGRSSSVVVSNCKNSKTKIYKSVSTYLDHFSALGYDLFNFSLPSSSIESNMEIEGADPLEGNSPTFIVTVKQRFQGIEEGEKLLYGDITTKQIEVFRDENGSFFINRISVLDTQPCLN